jgi:hypothetical protein
MAVISLGRKSGFFVNAARFLLGEIPTLARVANTAKR